jgi:hypothetical protein
MPNPFDVRFDGDDPRDLRFHAADSASAVILTASQVEEFNDRGFIAPVQLFNDEEISHRHRCPARRSRTFSGQATAIQPVSFAKTCAGSFDGP